MSRHICLDGNVWPRLPTLSDRGFILAGHRLGNVNAAFSLQPTLAHSEFRAHRSADCAEDAPRRGRDQDDHPTHRAAHRSGRNDALDPNDEGWTADQIYEHRRPRDRRAPSSSGIGRDSRGHGETWANAHPTATPQARLRALRGWECPLLQRPDLTPSVRTPNDLADTTIAIELAYPTPRQAHATSGTAMQAAAVHPYARSTCHAEPTSYRTSWNENHRTGWIITKTQPYRLSNIQSQS